MSSSKLSVIGFQYEPEKPDYDPNAQLTYDEQENDSFEPAEKRNAENIHEWCSCGKCHAMPTEQENVCCCDIDAIKYFHLASNSE